MNCIQNKQNASEFFLNKFDKFQYEIIIAPLYLNDSFQKLLAMNFLKKDPFFLYLCLNELFWVFLALQQGLLWWNTESKSMTSLVRLDGQNDICDLVVLLLQSYFLGLRVLFSRSSIFLDIFRLVCQLICKTQALQLRILYRTQLHSFHLPLFLSNAFFFTYPCINRFYNFCCGISTRPDFWSSSSWDTSKKLWATKKYNSSL